MFAKSLVAAACAVALGSPAAAQAVADSVYAKPQQLVTVDGARRLNLYCVGSGEPTVILEAGAGNGMVTWRLVQADIAGFTRVCAYDRAGLGFSDPGTGPADVRNLADDLARLVAAAGIRKPFVLVGHSLGGAIATLYAATHPGDVAGMVLVEPAFANDLEALQAELPPGKRTAIQDAMAKSLDFKRACLERARDGQLLEPATAADRACVETTWDPNRLDPALAQVSRRQLVEPRVWEAQISEMQAFVPSDDKPDANSAELTAVTFDFDAKPLIVLSRGVDEGGPGVPIAALPRVEAAWRAGHAALATRSTKGKHIVVPGARHYVQIDRPYAVISAVKRVVTDVRGQ